MPNPGDYIPAPEVGPTAVQLVDPERCGGCGQPSGGGGWRRAFQHCTCVERGGHQVWAHDCGWVLTVPPHDPEHRRQVY